MAFGQWAGVAGRYVKALCSLLSVSQHDKCFLFSVFTGKTKTQRKEKRKQAKG